MTTDTENHQFKSMLTLHDSSQSSLTIHAHALSLTKQDNELIESRLTFCINPELYKYIHTLGIIQSPTRNPLFYV